jgi:hypothetical protein
MDTVMEEPSQAAHDAALCWSVVKKDCGTVVEFAGEIDENADFSTLKRELRGDVEFQLAGITRVNSCGVREWVNFVRNLPHVSSLRFAKCSPAIVTQLNAIYNFRGPARIRSLLAPYVCESCVIEEYKVIDVHPRFPRASMVVPAFNCQRCGGPMEFDDLPERYLSFLKEA